MTTLFCCTVGLDHLRLIFMKGLPEESHRAPPLFLLRNRCIGVILRLLCSRSSALSALIPSSERGATVERVLAAIFDASVAVAAPEFLTQSPVSNKRCSTFEYEA